MTLQQIQKEAVRSLSYEERVELGHFLNEFDGLSSAPQTEIDKEWDTEISDRIKDIDEGRVETVDGDEVMKRLRAKYL
ncbi:MAG: putative addiction module component (TIGR02574 family) [Akkermansiaceae bacterium]|jgi:putative addiction module component (TIGR02574 family)